MLMHDYVTYIILRALTTGLRYAMIYFPPKNIQILTDQGFSCVRVTDGAWLMPTHN